ncbi:Utp14 protein-domain-containing protein [Blyttiomyces helicus]|uniref:Utp14 protein-domain-containing protein n=1 Tax=Blyttiomyces helicus TaxID=388810 RepID=A0A4P9WB04_9FUNG|nr:Utp14 protein-domain-containing protein [Blyttiomyces helicus]|eukprot:RKO89789.1 Utp14 protein-domain-containing protein [Blyttiomyces helicus]
MPPPQRNLKRTNSSAGRDNSRPSKQPRTAAKPAKPTRPPTTTSSASARRKTRRKETAHDVYEAADPDEESRSILVRRGGGGGAVGRTLDQVDNYEYHVDHIDEEDDEEIDEDEAFDDEDEEKYGAFFADKGTSDKRKKSTELNLNETEEDEDEDEDEEMDDDEEEEDFEPDAMMNLSDMLGGASSAQAKKPARHSSKEDEMYASLVTKGNESEDEVEVDDELLDDDESEEEDEEEEEEDEYGTTTRKAREPKFSTEDGEALTSFVRSLDARKGRGGDAEGKRKRAAEVTEAYDESEFNLGPRPGYDDTAASRPTIGFSDFLEALNEETGFGSLKKQLQTLDKGITRGKKAGPLDAPLPKRIQDKFGRDAAYTEAKKEVSKWTGIVKKNREADHLSFPMNLAPAQNATNASLVEKFELLERRAELAKMRSLLFYKEQKQKKIAKIKSKTYRKVHKKDKQDLSLEELKRLDPELAKQEMEKLAAERAQERMTLKHKNTGKWAKQMLGRHDADPETRKALMSQLDKHEALKRQIKGLDSDESDGDDGASIDGDGREEAIAALEKLEREMDDPEDAGATKGVFAMKFMQRGLDRQRAEARAEVRRARDDLESGDYEGSDGEGASGGEGGAPTGPKEVGTAVGGNAGRRVFGGEKTGGARPGASDDEDGAELLNEMNETRVRAAGPVTIDFVQKSKTPAKEIIRQTPLFEVQPFTVEEADDKAFRAGANKTRIEESETIIKPKATTFDAASIAAAPVPSAAPLTSKVQPPTASRAHPRPTAEPVSESNPWLATGDDTVFAKKSSKSNVGDSKAEKALDKLSKVRKRVRGSGDGADSNVLIDLGGVRALETEAADEEPEPAPAPAAKPPRRTVVAPAAGEDSDADSDVGEAEMPKMSMVHASEVKMLSNREIMRMAFAADDVAADFEEEKRRAIDVDKPKETDLTLPGWGSWGGSGVKPKKKKRVVQAAKPHEGVDESKRRDAQLKHVIINEKRQKKSVKYMVQNLPHGVGNREQYERTIQMPVGREWNAASVHTDLIKPRVMTKLGTVIAPLRLTGPARTKANARAAAAERSSRKL